MAQEAFRELLVAAIARYEEVERNAEGGVMHLERASKDVVDELIKRHVFDEPGRLRELVDGAIDYICHEEWVDEEVARLLLVPALVMAVKGEMGEEVQQILSRRYDEASVGLPSIAE